nr:hypothetical protein [uncultured Campylobacter sp.]
MQKHGQSQAAKQRQNGHQAVYKAANLAQNAPFGVKFKAQIQALACDFAKIQIQN